MSRNMIRSNQKVFLRLVDWAQKSERAIDHLNDVRWIETNDEDKQWLQDLDVGDVRTFSPRARTARLSFDGRNFFAAVGFAEKTQPDSILESIELNAGLFTALIAELDVPIREDVDPLAVINEILPQYERVEGYSGHAFTSVAQFFE